MVRTAEAKVVDSFYLPSRQKLVIGLDILDGEIMVGQIFHLDNVRFEVNEVSYLDKKDLSKSVLAILCNYKDEQEARVLAEKLERENTVLEFYEQHD